jgi:hypothetical protein
MKIQLYHESFLGIIINGVATAYMIPFIVAKSSNGLAKLCSDYGQSILLSIAFLVKFVDSEPMFRGSEESLEGLGLAKSFEGLFDETHVFRDIFFEL